MYARLRFLRWYFPALAKQTAIIVGALATAVGLIAGSILGLNIPRWAWLVLLVAGLAIGQFELYFKMRRSTTEYDPLPYWAQMPLNAQGGGTWLSVALFGKPASKLPLLSSVYPRLIDAAATRLAVNKDLLFHRSFSGGLQLRIPKNTMDPIRFNLQAGIEGSESACLQVIRTTPDDPLHIGWVMTYLEEMIRFCLSDASDDWVKKRKRQVRISLANWPANGIVVDGLFKVEKFSDQTQYGYRLTLDFAVGKRTNPWKIIKLFTSSVLADAGYVGYDGELEKVTTKDCLKYREKVDKKEVA